MAIDSTPLSGKTAIITGASRGIGRGIAEALATRGANVVIAYSSPDSDAPAADLATQLATHHNIRAISIRADLTEPGSEDLIVSKTLEAFPDGIDILVCNAGIAWPPPLQAFTSADFEKWFRVNTMSPLLLLQALLPHLKRPGRVINIGAAAARLGTPSISPLYTGSKGALEAITRSCATKLGADGTTVNCVVPGAVETDMASGAPEAILKMIKRGTPVEHRLGRVDDVADVVAWLAGKGARWVSGQCICVSGGSLML